MAQLRHGEPHSMSGWLFKEGKLTRMKHRRYATLEGHAFTSAKEMGQEQSFSVNITTCHVAAGRKKNEIIIDYGEKSVSFFADSAEEAMDWMKALENNSKRQFNRFYELGRLIASGATAKIFACTSVEEKELFAVKIIDRNKLNEAQARLIQNELLIMRTLNHRHVIRTYDILDSGTHTHVVMDNFPGLAFDMIAETGMISEKDAANFMMELLTGVAYLHRIGVVHRDLRPENILCRRRTSPLDVVIADFGISEFTGEDMMCASKEQPPGGYAAFMAPEIILNKEHGCAVDMWACGVLFYAILSGKMPFTGRSEEQIMLHATNGDYTFPKTEFRNVSLAAKSLVEDLLQVDDKKRLSAAEALAHPWLTQTKHSTELLQNDLTYLHSDRRSESSAHSYGVPPSSGSVQYLPSFGPQSQPSLKRGARSNSKRLATSMSMIANLEP